MDLIWKRLVLAIGKYVAAPRSANASPDTWTVLEHAVWRHFGVLGLIVLVAVVIWWKWERIGRLPFIPSIIARVTRKALPKAVPDKFNIAVTHLQRDKDRETEQLIIEALADGGSRP